MIDFIKWQLMIAVVLVGVVGLSFLLKTVIATFGIGIALLLLAFVVGNIIFFIGKYYQ